MRPSMYDVYRPSPFASAISLDAKVELLPAKPSGVKVELTPAQVRELLANARSLNHDRELYDILGAADLLLRKAGA